MYVNAARGSEPQQAHAVCYHLDSLTGALLLFISA